MTQLTQPSTGLGANVTRASHHCDPLLHPALPPILHYTSRQNKTLSTQPLIWTTPCWTIFDGWTTISISPSTTTITTFMSLRLRVPSHPPTAARPPTRISPYLQYQCMTSPLHHHVRTRRRAQLHPTLEHPLRSLINAIYPARPLSTSCLSTITVPRPTLPHATTRILKLVSRSAFTLLHHPSLMKPSSLAFRRFQGQPVAPHFRLAVVSPPPPIQRLSSTQAPPSSTLSTRPTMKTQPASQNLTLLQLRPLVSSQHTACRP